MNRTLGAGWAEANEFTAGLSPGVPKPTNKPYGQLFSGILIFHYIFENVDGFAGLALQQQEIHS